MRTYKHILNHGKKSESEFEIKINSYIHEG